jgi:hypothetical protein
MEFLFSKLFVIIFNLSYYPNYKLGDTSNEVEIGGLTMLYQTGT